MNDSSEGMFSVFHRIRAIPPFDASPTHFPHDYPPTLPGATDFQVQDHPNRRAWTFEITPGPMFIPTLEESPERTGERGADLGLRLVAKGSTEDGRRSAW